MQSPAPVDRRSVAELVARTQLEPSLRNIVVEGFADFTVMKWWLNRHGVEGDVSVILIDDIEIDAKILSLLNLPDGNRSRVIALAHELNQVLGNHGHRLWACIADRDFMDFSPFHSLPPNLLLTDFANMDLYACDERVMEKLCMLVGGGTSCVPGLLLSDVQTCASYLFLMRAANLRLGLGMHWSIGKRWISITNCRAKIDDELATNGYLSNNGRTKHRDAFNAEFEVCLKRRKGDIRMWMNGHDFFEVLWVVLRKVVKNPAALGSRDRFPNVVRGCLEVELLDQHDMFSRLRRVLDI